MAEAGDLVALRAAKRELSGRLLAANPLQVRAMAARSAISITPQRNVQGVGIGAKIVGGRITTTLAVKIYVRMKQTLGELSAAETLPTSVAGLPTDVEEIGLVLPLTQGRRPTQPGASIGPGGPDEPSALAGTFGALVGDIQGLYLLSNNHVLADENRLPFGAPISAPSPLDGGDIDRDHIAALCGYVPLDTNGDNYVDCAIALIDGNRTVSATPLQLAQPLGTAEARLHALVSKSGRTTGVTSGQVVSIDTDLQVPYDIGTLLFREQIAIRSLDTRGFSAAGDSGSLVVEDDSGLGVGLLFAGGPGMSFANHLDDVLQALGVALVTG